MIRTALRTKLSHTQFPLKTRTICRFACPFRITPWPPFPLSPMPAMIPATWDPWPLASWYHKSRPLSWPVIVAPDAIEGRSSWPRSYPESMMHILVLLAYSSETPKALTAVIPQVISSACGYTFASKNNILHNMGLEHTYICTSVHNSLSNTPWAAFVGIEWHRAIVAYLSRQSRLLCYSPTVRLLPEYPTSWPQHCQRA